MFRLLYLRLIKLHPAPFRQRFGGEMIDIFDCQADGVRATASLLADALLSLVRQRVFRSEFRQPLSIKAAAGPLLYTAARYTPRPWVLLNGTLLAGALFYVAAAVINKGSPVKPFRIGAHYAGAPTSTEKARAQAGTDMNSIVEVGPPFEDLRPVTGSLYFKSVRVLLALDSDEDLVISPSEILSAPAMLRWLDLNEDGSLDAEECGLFQSAAADRSQPELERARIAFMHRHPVLAVLDSNHDGRISESEIAGSVAALRKLDRNGDGRLTLDELLPEQAARAREGPSGQSRGHGIA